MKADAMKAAFPTCRLCGSGVQAIDETGRCRDRRECYRRRLRARGETPKKMRLQ